MFTFPVPSILPEVTDGVAGALPSQGLLMSKMVAVAPTLLVSQSPFLQEA